MSWLTVQPFACLLRSLFVFNGAYSQKRIVGLQGRAQLGLPLLLGLLSFGGVCLRSGKGWKGLKRKVKGSGMCHCCQVHSTLLPDPSSSLNPCQKFPILPLPPLSLPLLTCLLPVGGTLTGSLFALPGSTRVHVTQACNTAVWHPPESRCF